MAVLEMRYGAGVDDALTKARAALFNARQDSGALGYLPDQNGALEPTLLAVACGAIPPPMAWISNQPWSWEKLLIPVCLHQQRVAAEHIAETCDLLLQQHSREVDDPMDWLGFDATIDAWPWVKDTAPWVEPTAYAVLGLRLFGMTAHPRTQQGCLLLRDRQCEDGGWNYGNPNVLGAELESDLTTTAWAVMALPTSPATQRGLVRLQAAIHQQSTMTLSLSILAHLHHQTQPPEGMIDLLCNRQRRQGDFGGRLDWTALAACALQSAGGTHPFGPPP